MNKYEIVGIVGEGAYGIVYKAKNKENGEFGKYWDLNAQNHIVIFKFHHFFKLLTNYFNFNSGNQEIQRVD